MRAKSGVLRAVITVIHHPSSIDLSRHVLCTSAIMEKKNPFTILYNGKPVACMQLGQQFMVQLTYKPVYLQREKDDDGSILWVQEDEKRVTPLSEELGKLISDQYLINRPKPN